LPEQHDIRGRLREDHDGYLAELESLARERDPHRCKSRLGALRHAWAVHSLAEESVVYRGLEGVDETRFIEHELIEELFEKLARGRPGTLEWHARLKVARDLVARHIEHEYQDLFARLEKALDAAALARMAGEFTAERERLEQLEQRRAA